MRLIGLPVFILYTYAGTGWAAPKNSPPPAAPEKPAAAPAWSVQVSSPPASAEELVAHFQKLDQALQSLSAGFEQKVHLTASGIEQKVEGQVQYQKPNHLRVEHRSPEQQTIVTDGKSLWIHRHVHKQVIQTHLDEWRKQDPWLNSLLDMGQYAKLAENYNLSWDTHTLTASFKPKTGASFELRMRLKGPSFFPNETILEMENMRIESRLRDLKLNPKLKAELFQFDIPKDVEVLPFKTNSRGETPP